MTDVDALSVGTSANAKVWRHGAVGRPPSSRRQVHAGHLAMRIQHELAVMIAQGVDVDRAVG